MSGLVRTFAVLCALSYGALLPTSGLAEVMYTVLPLGVLPGDENSGANGINNLGQVVGVSWTDRNPGRQAFRTAANAPISADSNLGSLAGFSNNASAINDAGIVVGSGNLDGGSIRYRAFRTAPGGLITPESDLGTLGGLASAARDVNAAGYVVGYSTNADEVNRAFRVAPGEMITPASDLGTLGGSSSGAAGINDLGQVTGSSLLAGDQFGHAYRTEPNGLITPDSDLGALGSRSGGRAINNSGQVVGVVAVGDGLHAFRTTPTGKITPESDLGTLGGRDSQANDINSDGVTVGSSWLGGQQAVHAFVAFPDGPMLDLNNLIEPHPGWTLQQAIGINDSGQIIGVGRFNGEGQAFLLTPIPEPTGCIAGAFLAVTLRLRQRQRRF